MGALAGTDGQLTFREHRNNGCASSICGQGKDKSSLCLNSKKNHLNSQ